jgi:hypothetical protein
MRKTRKAVNKKRKSRKTRSRKQKGGNEIVEYKLEFWASAHHRESDDPLNDEEYQEAVDNLDNEGIWRQYIEILMTNAFASKNIPINNIPITDIEIIVDSYTDNEIIDGEITWKSLKIEKKYLMAEISDLYYLGKNFSDEDSDIRIDFNNLFFEFEVPKNAKNMISFENIKSGNMIVNIPQNSEKYTSNVVDSTGVLLTEKSYENLIKSGIHFNPITRKPFSPIAKPLKYKAKVV